MPTCTHSFTSLAFKLYRGGGVTGGQVNLCATLFSKDYGVWGKLASAPLKPGSRVRMNAQRLKSQSLYNQSNSVLMLCTVEDAVVGHAFATMWDYDSTADRFVLKIATAEQFRIDSKVCWVTQLVVSSDYRELGIATGLLRLLPGPDFTCHAIGLVSSHPAACLALLKRAHANIRKLDLDFIRRYSQKILKATPVSYVTSARLRGSLFQDDAQAGVVSTVFTEFYVDHGEPLQALTRWKENQEMSWPFGDLPEGYEFLCIAPLDK